MLRVCLCVYVRVCVCVRVRVYTCLLTDLFRGLIAAVGNSPLILDESSDHGIGQRYPHFDAISVLFRKLANVSDHVTSSKRLSSFRNNTAWAIASKCPHNVAQAVRTFRQIRRYLEQQLVVPTFGEFAEMYEWLGQFGPMSSRAFVLL
jgi:hypothetical protein